MTEREKYRPFTHDNTSSVPLKSAPLALALCQVRWPQLNTPTADFEKQAVAVGSALTGYPLLERSDVAVVHTPTASPTVEPLFRWQDASRTWTISLGRTFVTVATKHYDGFNTFSERVADAIAAVGDIITPPVVNRIGLRYTNVLATSGDESSGLVRPELAGYPTMQPASADINLIQAMTEVRYHIGEYGLQARSGIVPEGSQFDPIVPPLEDESWILDLDAFREREEPFEVDATLSQVGVLADISYDFFRWVTPKEIHLRFGGERRGD